MKKFFSEIKGHLMTGIGYMLPLIIGSSLVVAIPQLIALAMGTPSLTEDLTGFLGFLYQVQQVGWTGIGMVNTVLAAFIAYSIADKPAIGAGFVAGGQAPHTPAGVSHEAPSPPAPRLASWAPCSTPSSLATWLSGR